MQQINDNIEFFEGESLTERMNAALIKAQEELTIVEALKLDVKREIYSTQEEFLKALNTYSAKVK